MHRRSLKVGMFVMRLGDDGWMLFTRYFFLSDQSTCSDGTLLLERPAIHASFNPSEPCQPSREIS